MRVNLRYLAEVIIVFVLCYFPLCYRIDVLPVNQWDEARNAVHTVEMLENHNYLIRTYQGLPETWEPKPPMLVWLQLASSKIFGLNELAIRFPVMISTFLTVIVLILFFAKFLNDRYSGYLSALILVTSQGYIGRHIARTGDHDALLVLVTTAVILLFYIILQTEKPKKSWFVLIALLLSLGVFIKSVSVLLIIPGLLISSIVGGRFKKILTNRMFYISFIVFLIPVAAYYFARERVQPGYMKAVWQWELFPRYINPENLFLAETFWYYAINLFKERYTWWIWILMVSLAAVPLMPKGPKRKFLLYILLNATIFFLLISAGSKNLWYDGPLYPLFALVIAIFISKVFKQLKSLEESNGVKSWLGHTVRILFLGILLYFPYHSIIKKVSRTQVYPWEKEIYALGDILGDKKALDSLPEPLKVVFESYNAHLLFYARARNYEYNRERVELTGFRNVHTGDTILISQQKILDSLDNKFNFEILLSDDPVKLVRIMEK